MFDNILTKNNINFNLLEKKIYKFVCEIGCSLLREIIENYDRELQESRDKKIYRHRGLKQDSIKTVMGIVDYKRTIYEVNENEQKSLYFC